MIRCEDCKPLILDHLYGLLDDPRAGEIAAHLGSCPSCSASRDEAARAQGLFARAAKFAFPRVQFVPPNQMGANHPRPAQPAAVLAPETPSSVAAPVPPIGVTDRKGLRLGSWAGWIIAASVMIAVPGTVIPVLGVLNRAELAHKATENSVAQAAVAGAERDQALQEMEKRRTDLEKNLETARQSQELLLANWVAEEKKLVTAQTARKASVDVVKPATVQPGAPNDFQLVLEDHGLPPKTRLVAEIRDQNDAVIHSQRLETERRDNHQVVRLPAQAWTRLTPQSELFLVVASVDEKTSAKAELQEKIRLFGPVYTTMLVTDRPSYHPGELLYFRSLTLDRVTFQPPTREQVLQYELLGPTPQNRFSKTERGGTDLIRVRDGGVEPVLGPDGKAIRGVGCGAIALPADLPDGDYTLTVSELPHPPEFQPLIRYPVSRTIHVHSGPVEAYAKRIGFSAASYAPGSTVEAWAELKFQGQPAADAEVVRAVAQADNLQLVIAAAPRTGPDGKTRMRFTLPSNPDLTDLRLKVTFKTRNGEESVAERVPLISRKVIVEFFPEGGSLVAGLPNRVYVRGTTATGQPVDLRGVITDGKKELARVETLTDANEPGVNRGLGFFTYTPEAGRLAWLKLESPADVIAPIIDGASPGAHAALGGAAVAVVLPTGFLLPKALPDGVVMHVANPVTAPGEPFHVQLHSASRERHLVIGAYTRGRLSDTKRISVKAGAAAQVELMGDRDPRGGVVRITVFEEPGEQAASRTDLKPISERLVYRKPGELLNLSFAPTSASLPGEQRTFPANTPIDLTITATDEKGRPTPAILWAAAVNAGLELGRKDRLLTTHFLLAGEISTPDLIENADFLLTDHPRAGEALDLVLATQGWRRFVEQTPAGFLGQRNMALADPPASFFRGVPNFDRTRLQANNGQFPIHAELPAAQDRRKLYDAYWPRYEMSLKALADAQAAREAELADATAVNRVRELASRAQDSQSVASGAAERARAASATVERMRSAGWYGVAGFGLLALMLGALACSRATQRTPHGIGTLGSLGLAAFLAATLSLAEQTRAGIEASQESARALENSQAGSLAIPEIMPPRDVIQIKKTDGGEETHPGPDDSNRAQTTPGFKGPRFAKNMQVLPDGPPRLDGPPPSDWLPRGRAIQDSELTHLNTAAGVALANGAAEREKMKRSSEQAKAYAADRANTVARYLDEVKRKAGIPADKQRADGQPAGANNRDASQSTDAKAFSHVREALSNTQPLVVREFAAPRPGAAENVPAETILWQPVIVLPGDGKITLPLQLGAAEGGYHIVVAGHTLDGRIGAVRGVIGISLPDAPALTPAPLPTKKP